MNNKLEVIGIDHGWSMMKTISQIKRGPNQLMEYSILNANLVLTKCFDIKLYLI
jgi:hypothetical protein